MCDSFSSPSSDASVGTESLVPTSARRRQASAFSFLGASDFRTAISLASGSLAEEGASCPKVVAAPRQSSAGRQARRGNVLGMVVTPSGWDGSSIDPRLALGAGAQAVGLGIADELLLHR